MNGVWTLETLRSHRDEIIPLAARHGTHNLRVFGSVVRGEAWPSSDVDFLAEFEPTRSLFDLGALIVDLEALLHCKVDVVSDHGLGTRFCEHVEREAIIVHDSAASPNGLTQDLPEPAPA